MRETCGKFHTYQGKAMPALRSTNQPGVITLTVKAEGLATATKKIAVV